jgi:hypothetical protein
MRITAGFDQVASSPSMVGAQQFRTVGLYKIHRIRLSASSLSDDGFSDAGLVSAKAIR